MRYSPHIIVATLFDTTHGKFLYSFNEMTDLISVLDNAVEGLPARRQIIRLLVANQKFLTATPPEKYFSDMRNKNRTADMFEMVLKTMANEMSIAELALNQYAKDSKNHKLLKSAISYCYQAILIRINTLKQLQDPFYTEHWQKSSLHQQIRTHNQANTGGQ